MEDEQDLKMDFFSNDENSDAQDNAAPEEVADTNAELVDTEVQDTAGEGQEKATDVAVPQDTPVTFTHEQVAQMVATAARQNKEPAQQQEVEDGPTVFNFAGIDESILNKVYSEDPKERSVGFAQFGNVVMTTVAEALRKEFDRAVPMIIAQAQQESFHREEIVRERNEFYEARPHLVGKEPIVALATQQVHQQLVNTGIDPNVLTKEQFVTLLEEKLKLLAPGLTPKQKTAVKKQQFQTKPGSRPSTGNSLSDEILAITRGV